MSEYGPGESLKRQRQIYDEEKAGTYKPPAPLSGEELEALERQIKVLDKMLKEGIKAKYKLEIQFGKNRTTIVKPYPGVMSCWLSGTKFHGGGDEKIFECPRCDGWIFPEQISQRTIQVKGREPEFCSISVCGKCGGIWRSEQTVGERFFNLTVQDWTYAILKMFRRLQMDADLYLKFHREDIRYRTMMEMARDRGGEEIAKARKLRGLHIYPLRNIVKDVGNGSEMYSRIRAFITA
ncbi:MAG: hypothetical protein KAY24_20005 [Candidatus Eisenbacteria sp.]|nr:hypothetical protein [Candidatus Eisenbacteria bacterium]